MKGWERRDSRLKRDSRHITKVIGKHGGKQRKGREGKRRLQSFEIALHIRESHKRRGRYEKVVSEASCVNLSEGGEISEISRTYWTGCTGYIANYNLLEFWNSRREKMLQAKEATRTSV